MPEYHPGTEIEIPDGVPTSGFRNAIKNPKRYMKHNSISLENVCEASYKGDYDRLEEMLSTGDELNLFNGDLNAHESNVTALHMAAMMGQTECVELLLRAKADPHVRECVPYGRDPEDGKTAMSYARDYCWDDCAEILEQAEKDTPYGYYIPFGDANNSKQYDCWEFGTKPVKGFFSSRPGAAERMGFDPMKYGTGALPEERDEEEDVVATTPRIGAGLSRLPVAILFPGQGSQYVKMMSNVANHPEVVSMLTKAKEILGWDVLELCLQGPDTKLEQTRFCQPAMFVAGMAGLVKLKKDRPEHGERFTATAGLSLGEYPALCAAGVFSFEDGLRLVKIRGQAMQEAAELGKQAVLSIAGLERPMLEELCEQAKKKIGGSCICQIANVLFPKGFSCAGTESAILVLKELCDQANAMQAKILKMSGAFHTPYMEPALEKFGQALDDMLPKMNPPDRTVYMNATGQGLPPGTDPAKIVQLLKEQLTSPVLWEPTIRNMIKAGITTYYECGPMKQIKAMMKRIDSKVWGNTSNLEI